MYNTFHCLDYFVITEDINVLRSGVYPTGMGLTPNKILVSFKLDLLTNSDQWNINICTEYLSTFSQEKYQITCHKYVLM